MKYPLFASFIIFSLTLMNLIRKRRQKEEKTYRSFLDEEAAANSVRKKPLDDLELITIPFDTLPMDILATDPKVMEYHNILRDLSENPIANLTGFTNTELKFKYGAPNLELLSRYDASYTSLARTLSSWAKILFDNGYEDESVTILEFAVSTNTDVRSTYDLLGQIYSSHHQSEKIKELILGVSKINSLNKKPILNILDKHLSESSSDNLA